MPNYNKVILIGHLARDPELRYTAQGKAIAKFTIAVSRKWTGKDGGEAKEEVAFVECDAFGTTAENISKYMKKGSAMLVEGRLKQDNWDDKTTGQKRSKLGVVVEGTQFLGSPKHADGGGATSKIRPEDMPHRPEKPGVAPQGPACETEEVPF